ncbi:hypothetical protein NPIL_648661 [Nephila pilipes]|uniref:Uncharacterized protein n=1 Tax=Nephila pilipes TaxID=299642 RepID=A0A8X6Q877_NEPPI|nr:hypothetical protein NPIL_648661 [Nephila pilipes]
MTGRGRRGGRNGLPGMKWKDVRLWWSLTYSINIETLNMPRSRKVFKKRKGTFCKGRNITSSSNSTLDADVSNIEMSVGIKNSCAKEEFLI